VATTTRTVATTQPVRVAPAPVAEPPVAPAIRPPPVTTTIRTPTVTPVPQPLPEPPPARDAGSGPDFVTGRHTATEPARTGEDYARPAAPLVDVPSSSTHYEGVLEEAGFALMRPSRYRLVRHVNGRAVTICYVVYDESKLQSLLGSEVEVSGQEYRMQGLRHHVLEATQVTRK
jgi:hypothetical protein